MIGHDKFDNRDHILSSAQLRETRSWDAGLVGRHHRTAGGDGTARFESWNLERQQHSDHKAYSLIFTDLYKVCLL